VIDFVKLKPWEQIRLANIKRRRRNNKILLGIAVVLAFWLGWIAKSYACGDVSTKCTACQMVGGAL